MTRQRLTMVVCGAAVLTAMSGASARGQITSRLAPPPCVDAPRLLVITPAGATKKARIDAEKELRSQLRARISTKEICVIPEEESDAILQASGWPTDSSLSVIDAFSLAQTQLRADEILMTSISEAGGNFEYTGQVLLVLDRNSQWMRDSVPRAAGDARLSLAARLFVDEFKPVRKQFSHAKTSNQKTRAGQFAEAAAAARLGIAAFPKGLISRMCLAEALVGERKTVEYLAVVDEIRARDPQNVRALQIAMQGYFDRSDTSKFADVAGHIVSLDPTNPRVESIIETLAAWRKADIAIPMIRQVVRDDPENKRLLEIEFSLIYSAGNWRDAAARGEALAPIDTAYVDTSFVLRMVSVYANDSVPPKQPQMLQWLTRGTQKFPQNLTLARGRAQLLKSMGQTQAAIDEYRRLLGLQPKVPQIRLYIATYYDELGQTDSAVAWGRRAAESGDDKAQASTVVLGIGLKRFNAATTKLRDTAQQAAAIEDLKQIIPLLALADTLNPSDPPKFYWGFAAYSIGATAVTNMSNMKPPAKPTCEMLKDARPWLETANEKMLQGGRANGATAAQLIGQIPTLLDYIDKVGKQLKCA